MPALALIHTVVSLPAVFQPLVAAALPTWSSFNIVDESLLQNTLREGALSQQTRQRLANYIFSAAAAGADAVVVTCSTLGNAVDDIVSLSSVPLFRIDQGMANEAVTIANRIGVLATLPTTLEPTGTAIRNAAAAAGRDCTLTEVLCDGAFARLSSGDRAAHDRMVVEGFNQLAREVDIIVLAQASMTQSLVSLASPPVPFLTSPQLGIAHVARELASHSS
ncbi:Asp/Glu/hydantoin racemase [Rhizobium sp. BK529]|uniref:aspartate/glutamate racemase family protein n=1 Tax=unclassified Rhizobium TaxID=2613769 RepID=UPI00104B1080|nr:MULTISPECIES: aspartate/glutamate racemase family protein [unclassified Rhizobium]MBB3593906.1 Asp/Glu/hydantoin racemase [Rhizobium sp. BK529]TCS01363.1 hypothetical protein EV281_106108 [Rhizobium sp. BK418]